MKGWALHCGEPYGPFSFCVYQNDDVVWVYHRNIFVKRDEIEQYRPVSNAEAQNIVPEATIFETSTRVTDAKLKLRVQVRCFSKVPSH